MKAAPPVLTSGLSIARAIVFRHLAFTQTRKRRQCGNDSTAGTIEGAEGHELIACGTQDPSLARLRVHTDKHLR